MTQTCLDKLQEKNEASANLPDILRTPSSRKRRDTLASFSSLYYTASEESIDETSQNKQKTSFHIERPDSCFYSGIETINNDNLDIDIKDIKERGASENEDKKGDKEKIKPLTSPGIQNYLNLGKKCLFATMKIVWVGDAGVGKTSLINVLMGNKFTIDCRPTLGVDFATQLVPGPGEEAVKLQFWDFSGQDRFRLLSRAYFKGAQGCLMVFDSSRRSSFEQLPQWGQQLKDQDQNEDCFTILLANKDDLDSAVDDDEMELFVNACGLANWKRVSAVDGRGLKDALDTLVRGMIEKERRKRESKEQNYYSCPDIFKLGESKRKSDQKSICNNC